MKIKYYYAASNGRWDMEPGITVYAFASKKGHANFLESYSFTKDVINITRAKALKVGFEVEKIEKWKYTPKDRSIQMWFPIDKWLELIDERST